ncbi:MAG TPA: S8 family serine peptidase [Candidatus Eisenbacteria bacterium]
MTHHLTLPGRARRAAVSILAILVLPVIAFARPVQSPGLSAFNAAEPDRPGFVVNNLPGSGLVIDLMVEGPATDSELEALGAIIGSRLPNGVRTVRMPVARLDDLRALPSLTRLVASRPVRMLNDSSVPLTLATPNYWTSAPPNFTGSAGTNVIVGIVDSGIDWSHDDFKNPDGTTRILNIWDQNIAGVNPAGFAYGNECTQAQINAGTCSETDAVGHGTHVAGSAAGDGSATGNGQPANRFIGMAPRANIIVVATNFSGNGVVDGVNYIFQKAAALGRPAVVNLSLGSQYGAHDGTEGLDTALSALTGPGKIIVASAGNEGGSSRHAEQLVPPGPAQTITFNVPAYAAAVGANNDYVILDCYYNGSANMSVTVTSPGPTPVVLGPITKGTNGGSGASLAGTIYAENGFTPSASGATNILIQVFDSNSARTPRVGVWTVTLTPVATVASTECDLWLADFHLGTAGVAATFTSDVENAELVGTPGTGNSIISVAAFTSKQFWPSIDTNSYSFVGSTPAGPIAGFSSPGPRRDGAQKPDIAAPGTAIVSSRSTATAGIPNALINPDGVHWTQQGTSMSSPHVTGAVALYLADSPTMTPAQARTRLAADALVDGNTGAVPNATWGAGKLRMIRADAVPPMVTLTAPNGGQVFIEGSMQNITWTATDNVGVTAIDLAYSTNNGGAWTTIVNGEPNDGTYSWTVPAVTTIQALVRVTAHDALNTASDASNAVFAITSLSAAPDRSAPPVRPIALANAPNPFGASTIITFGLPANENVKLSIVSPAGRLVRRLLDGSFPAGWHDTAWNGTADDGRQVAQGIYFYKFEAGDVVTTQRMVLTR